MNTLRAPRALLLAVALTLGLALPAAAATSQQAAETLTVNSSLAITGVPASLAYGAGNVGTVRTAPAVTATVTTNNPSGANLLVAGSDLARTGGGGSIASTNRGLAVVAGTGSPTLLSPYDQAGGAAYPGPAGTAVVVAVKNSAGEWSATITPSVTIPAAAAPGNYTGTLTFSVVDRP